MKRFPIVISATAAGLAGILSFHSRSATVPLSRTSAAAAAKSGRVSKVTSHPTITTSPPTTTVSPSSTASASAVGASEQYGYGVVSVRVTVRGTRITDVSVVNLQTAESYSQQIADQVIPYLRGQVLQLQSAQVNGISGATYTSEAYAMSVQSALHKLHVS